MLQLKETHGKTAILINKKAFHEEVEDKEGDHPSLIRVIVLLLLLLVTRPLPRDGGMAVDHGAPKAEQLPMVWTRGRKETESRQRISNVRSP